LLLGRARNAADLLLPLLLLLQVQLLLFVPLLQPCWYSFWRKGFTRMLLNRHLLLLLLL
jgi:hypothetical protein